MLPEKLKVRSIISLLAGLYNIPKSEAEKAGKEFNEILKKKLENIDSVVKANLILRMAGSKNADIYLLHDFFIDVYYEKIPGIIDKIKNQDLVTLEIDSVHMAYTDVDKLSLVRPGENNKYEAVTASEK